MAAVMWYGWAVEFLIQQPAPPDAPAEDRERLRFSGRFIFLTVNILTFEASFWVASLVAEVSRLVNPSKPLWGATTLAYTLSVFVAALGFMLTVLFLKFCWFEEGWRIQVLIPQRQKDPWFGFYTLANHCPSLLVAFADILVVKDRLLLAHFTPSVLVLLLMALGWAGMYLGWIELNYANNGGIWPYPVLDEVFRACFPKVGFVVLVPTYASY